MGLTIFGANIFKEAGAGMQGKSFDNTADAEALREDLMAIARTTLSSKILTHDKDYFAKIAVDAVMCLKGRTNLEPIQFIKKPGGTLRDSFLADVRPFLCVLPTFPFSWWRVLLRCMQL